MATAGSNSTTIEQAAKRRKVCVGDQKAETDEKQAHAQAAGQAASVHADRTETKACVDSKDASLQYELSLDPRPLEPTVAPQGDWEVWAQEVIKIHYGNLRASVLGTGQPGGVTFSPYFTHQVFDDELIKGYRNPAINIYLQQDTLDALLDVHFDAVQADNDPNRLIAELVACLPSKAISTDRTAFEQELRASKAFVPFGDNIGERPDSKGGIFELFICPVSTPAARRYIERLHLLLLFFVDAASMIDVDDPDWELVTIFHKTDAGYRLAGFTTLHSYFGYPDTKKLRLSQMLILPPFQRQGLGAFGLLTLYKLAHERKAIELNIEEPAPAFQQMRTVLDLYTCAKIGAFCSLKNGKLVAKPDQLKQWNPKFGKQIQTSLKITKRQVRECFEVCQLLAIAQQQNQQTKTVTEIDHRRGLKRRIYASVKSDLAAAKTPELVRKLLLQKYFEADHQRQKHVLEKFVSFVANPKRCQQADQLTSHLSLTLTQQT